MTTVLSIDVLEKVPATFSTTMPSMTARLWTGYEPPPPADVTVIVARELAPHLIRQLLEEAADQLTADTGPHLKLGPNKRKVFA